MRRNSSLCMCYLIIKNQLHVSEDGECWQSSMLAVLHVLIIRGRKREPNRPQCYSHISFITFLILQIALVTASPCLLRSWLCRHHPSLEIYTGFPQEEIPCAVANLQQSAASYSCSCHPINLRAGNNKSESFATQVIVQVLRHPTHCIVYIDFY